MLQAAVQSVRNEKALQDHQNRVRSRVVAMSLLLQVQKYPKIEGQRILLQESSHALLESDESAYSLIPSRRCLLTHSSSNQNSVDTTDLMYHGLNYQESYSLRDFTREDMGTH